MAPEIVRTGDGSATLRSARYGETYHSVHGAAREAREVFLAASGVAARLDAGRPTRVLEIGFGLGLNFLLSAERARSSGTRLDYHALEHDPLDAATLRALGHERVLADAAPLGALLAMLELGERRLSSGPAALALHLADAGAARYPDGPFDAIYLDAFSPPSNPECWTAAVFAALHAALAPGGTLASYCVRGEVRRALAAVGFAVAKRPGPPGKRETLLATRPA